MKYALFLILFIALPGYAQKNDNTSNSNKKNLYVVDENKKAFLEHDLDRYVVYDLMSDGSKVFKDTLDFNEYRDKAIFTITQNQTILNYQLWATISLLIVALGLLAYQLSKK